MLLGRQSGEEGVRGEEKRLEVKREEGGEERSGAAGNHRYVQDGGWVAWREDRENCGILEERRNGESWGD